MDKNVQKLVFKNDKKAAKMTTKIFYMALSERLKEGSILSN